MQETSSPGHATESGKGQELDYGINRVGKEAVLTEEELVEVEPIGRFELFEEVVRRLGICRDFSIEEKACFRLPWPKGSIMTATDTSNGKPVHCYVVKLKYRSVLIFVFEVDVESLQRDHKISNLIVMFKNDSEKGIRGILQSCSTNGVKWDVEYIEKLTKTFETCNHPRRITKRNGISVEVDSTRYIDRWTNTLEKNIRKVGNRTDLN